MKDLFKAVNNAWYEQISVASMTRARKSMKSPVFLIFATRYILRARQKFTRVSRSKKFFRRPKNYVEG